MYRSYCGNWNRIVRWSAWGNALVPPKMGLAACIAAIVEVWVGLCAGLLEEWLRKRREYANSQ
jgi:hypothetical protein